jgi:hypothetical protein
MNNELWLPVGLDFPGYFISNKGRVFMKNGRISQVKASSKDGYVHINMSNSEGKPAIKMVHRLVAKAFIPNPDNKPVVNHKNCERDDNNVENLEWATVAENNQTENRIGYTSPEVRKVVQYGLDGSYIKIWDSLVEVEKSPWN